MWAYVVGPEYPDLRARKNNSETKRNEVERVRNYDDEACKGKDIQIHYLIHVQVISSLILEGPLDFKGF